MAVPLSSPSTGAEMNVVEFREDRSSQMAERELQLEDHSSSSVRARAALGSLDSQEPGRGESCGFSVTNMIWPAFPVDEILSEDGTFLTFSE